ncbi:MAG TPA: hypothetical protein VMZ91_06130 [Candidatus Paceibacterota bacterium]|nr:hypothetical protein [Candidatus Paceibacterota bacterium]
MLITIYKNSLRYFDLHPKCIIKDGQPVAFGENGYVVPAIGPSFLGFSYNSFDYKKSIIYDENIKILVYCGEFGEYGLSEDLFDDSFHKLKPHDRVCIKNGKISSCDYNKKEKDISFGYVRESDYREDNVQYIIILVTNIVI